MTNWYQQHLTPPEVLEAHLRLGVIPSAHHAQVDVQLKDPTTGVLIAEWSIHHRHSDEWQDLITEAAAHLRYLVAEHYEPF